jgi:ACS family tartrate transporter-like MFS transporter
MTAVCALPPSRRVGARIWTARIMLSWGIVSGAMAFIPQFASWTGFSPEHTF